MLKFTLAHFFLNKFRLDDVYMGILSQSLGTTIINIGSRFYFNRDQDKNFKTKSLRKDGINKFWFILEYTDLVYYWKLILVNETVTFKVPFRDLNKPNFSFK